MAEQELESGSEVPEAQASPTPKISEPSGAKQASAPETDVDSLVERLSAKLLPVLQENAAKAAQAQKDKRFAGIERDLDTLKAYLDAAGGDTQKAKRDYAIDEMLSRGEQTSKPDIGMSWQREWQDGSDDILKTATDDFGVKIDRNDPEFLDVARGNYTSPAQAFAALNRVVARRVKQSKAGVSAVASEGQPAAPAAVGDHAAISKKLNAAISSHAPIKEREALAAQLKEALKTAS